MKISRSEFEKMQVMTRAEILAAIEPYVAKRTGPKYIKGHKMTPVELVQRHRAKRRAQEEQSMTGLREDVREASLHIESGRRIQ